MFCYELSRPLHLQNLFNLHVRIFAKTDRGKHMVASMLGDITMVNVSPGTFSLYYLFLITVTVRMSNQII